MPTAAGTALEIARSGVLPRRDDAELPYALGVASAAGRTAVLIAAGGDERGYHVVCFLFEERGGEPDEAGTFTNPWPGDLFDRPADLPDHEIVATAVQETGGTGVRIVSGRAAPGVSEVRLDDRPGERVPVEPRTGAFVALHPLDRRQA